jgi:hypothetical protein
MSAALAPGWPFTTTIRTTAAVSEDSVVTMALTAAVEKTARMQLDTSWSRNSRHARFPAGRRDDRGRPTLVVLPRGSLGSRLRAEYATRP